MSAAAQALNCTAYCLKRLVTAWEQGGVTLVQQLRWGAGAPCKMKATRAELDWLLDPGTLTRQSHMTLAQRAGAFNLKFGRVLTARDVSELYQGAGVTRQHYCSSLGPPKPTPERMAASKVKIELA
jgi:transposase